MGAIELPEYKNPVSRLSLYELAQLQKRKAFDMIYDQVKPDEKSVTLGLDPIWLTKSKLLAIHRDTTIMFTKQLIVK